MSPIPSLGGAGADRHMVKGRGTWSWLPEGGSAVFAMACPPVHKEPSERRDVGPWHPALTALNRDGRGKLPMASETVNKSKNKGRSVSICDHWLSVFLWGTQVLGADQNLYRAQRCFNSGDTRRKRYAQGPAATPNIPTRLDIFTWHHLQIRIIFLLHYDKVFLNCCMVFPNRSIVQILRIYCRYFCLIHWRLFTAQSCLTIC